MGLNQRAGRASLGPEECGLLTGLGESMDLIPRAVAHVVARAKELTRTNADFARAIDQIKQALRSKERSRREFLILRV